MDEFPSYFSYLYIGMRQKRRLDLPMYKLMMLTLRSIIDPKIFFLSKPTRPDFGQEKKGFYL